MLARSNTLIRETIQRLSNPEKWNANGNYQHGKACIVTACSGAAVQRSHGGYDCNHKPALATIRRIIEERFGLTRGCRWSTRDQREIADIIDFNDHPDTTHGDVMWVLFVAERDTRPFWRKPLVWNQ